MAQVKKWHIWKNKQKWHIFNIGVWVGVGGGGLGVGVWGLGKFNISVPFLPTSPFVPL